MNQLTVGMVAAMPFPVAKASSIRVKNQIEAIKRHVAVRLYCLRSSPTPPVAEGYECIAVGGVGEPHKLRDYYSWQRKLALDWALARVVARDIRRGKISLLHVHTVEGVFISLLARLWALRHIPVVADIHGPFVEELIYYRMIPAGRVLGAWYGLLERGLYSTVQKIIATSCGLASVLRRKVNVPSKVEVVSDYVNLDAFGPAAATPEWSGRLKPAGRRLVMYVGTLKGYQGIEVLLAAARIVCRGDCQVRFVVVGDGGNGVAYYRQMAAQYQLSEEEIVFTGQVAHESISEYLSLADILVSPRKDTPVTQGGFVSQLPEYLAAGKVIVATAVSDCPMMLADGAGIVVAPDNPEALAEGIMQALRLSIEASQQMCRRAHQRAKAFSWQTHGLRLVQLYKELAG